MSLNSEVYDAIRKRIVDGEFAEDERFSANALAKELGVSRTPVRDAVQMLVSEGLLTSVAKSGLRLRVFTYRECEEAFEMRLAIEPFIASRAAERCDYDRGRALRSLCFRMAESARKVCRSGFADRAAMHALWALDNRFHLDLARISGNRTMLRALETTNIMHRKNRYPSVPAVREVALTLLEHWRIAQAVRRGDTGEARRRMEDHTRRGMHRALQVYQEPGREATHVAASAGIEIDP